MVAVKNKRKPEKTDILGFSIEGIKKEDLFKCLLILTVISVLTKFFIILITTQVFNSFLDYYDVTYYLKFAANIYQGQIPYVDFSADYPQVALYSYLIPFQLALLTQSVEGFVIGHQIFMTILDVFTTILVYLVTLRFYGKDKAFLAGLMYSTAFAGSYFVLTKFDSLPVFLLMLSVFLFVHRKNIFSYFTATIGFFSKLFPGIAIPFFFIYDLKNDNNPLNVVKKILPAVIFGFLITIPFLIMNFKGYLNIITAHSSKDALAHSFPMFLDNILHNTLNITFFSDISTYLFFIVALILLIAYFFLKEKNYINLIFFIFATIFFFLLFNKIFSTQNIMWITPFLAIFLANTYKEVILFYIFQLWAYLEFPIFYNSIYINYNYPYYISSDEPFLNVSIVFFAIKFLIMIVLIYVVFKRLNKSGDLILNFR